METSFYHPTSLQDAINILGRNDNMVLVNGGSDVILNIVAKKIDPAGLVYLRDIQELNYIFEDDEYVHFGGNITFRQMLASPICQRIGGLRKAIEAVGSPAIRAVATPSGNIATAAPAADCATMLLALRAEVVLVSEDGERIIPQNEIYLGAYKTKIKENEIIKEIRFPKLKDRMGSGYVRISRRKAQDIAKIIVGATISLDEQARCNAATISLGALNSTAVRASSIENQLIGLEQDEAILYAENNFPIEAGLRDSYFKEYKKNVLCDAVAQAIKMAFLEAKGDK